MRMGVVVSRVGSDGFRVKPMGRAEIAGGWSGRGPPPDCAGQRRGFRNVRVVSGWNGGCS